MSEQNANPTGEAGNSTFTQEQVNQMLARRIAEEKSKMESTFAEREKELTAREFTQKARETLTAKGLSHDLLEAMNTSSPEAFERSLSIFEKYTGPKPTPAKVNSGGEHSEPAEGEGESIRAAMGLK